MIKKEDIIRHVKAAIKKEPVVLIDLLVKEIVLYDDKMEITLNYTERTDGNDHQPFLFYSVIKSYTTFVNGKQTHPIITNLKADIFI